jgi:hypothetical protein
MHSAPRTRLATLISLPLLPASLPLLLALVVGAVPRLVLALTAPPFLVANDSADYFAGGLALWSTGQLDLGVKRTPLYVLELAGLIGVGGPSLDRIVALQHVLGLLTIALAYVVGCQAFGRLAGGVAALAVAINGSLLTMEHTIISEVLATPLLLGSLAALFAALRQPRAARWLLAGVLLGLGVLCRPLGIAVVGAALVALLATGLPRGVRARAAGLILLGVAVCLVPWMARQQMVHDQPMVNGGLGDALFSRVHRYDPTFTLRHDAPWNDDAVRHNDSPQGDEQGRAIRARIVELAQQYEYPREVRADLRAEFGIDDREADRQLRSVALATIFHDPGRYVLGTLTMAGRLARGSTPHLDDLWESLQRERVVDGWPTHLAWALTTDRPLNDVEAYSRAVTWLGVYRDDLPSGLAPLALAPLGAAWALMTHRRTGNGLIPLILISQIVLYVALDGPLGRYRYPLQPLITLLGAAGLALVVGQIAATWRSAATEPTQGGLVTLPARPGEPQGSPQT